MSIFLILIIAIVGIVNYYLARRIYQCLHLVCKRIPFWVYITALAVLTLTLIFVFIKSMLPVPASVKHAFGVIGAYWMGIFIYLLLFFLLSDVVLLLGRLIRLIDSPVSARIRFVSGIAAILLTVGTSCYGFIHATQLKEVSYDIPLIDKVMEQDITIVMISDLHLGAVGSESRLPAIVRQINAQNPDLVCIAGDFFDSDYEAIRDPDKARELLKSITATYGVFACLGNHDAGKTVNDMLAFLSHCNIQVLNDTYTIIDNRLILLGRLDASPIGGYGELQRQELQQILTNVNINLPVVVMDHNPTHVDTYQNEVDLILSGHTHKGQIFPGSLFTNLMYTVDHGYYQKDANSPHVIVSSGVGAWGMPMRVGTDCEIVTIRLHS